MKFFKKKCPKCRERGLGLVNRVRATALVEGRRAPASWSYYLCEKCGARLKLPLGGGWGEVGVEARGFVLYLDVDGDLTDDAPLKLKEADGGGL